LDQIKKSSEVISRLIEENSVMIDAQQFKKRLHVGIAKAESISLLMNEKQFLCTQLHRKNIALENALSEKKELKIQLEKYETSSNGFLQQIHPKNATGLDVLTVVPGIPAVFTAKMSGGNSPQEVEAILSVTPQKEIPKIEKIRSDSADKRNTTPAPTPVASPVSAVNKVFATFSESSRSSTPIRNAENSGKISEFEEVSLANQFEIDNSLKPADKLIIPSKQDPHNGSWLRGWGTAIWDVVTGRV